MLKSINKNFFPDNIDLFVGGMAETPYKRTSKVGMTFWCILIEQFTRLRNGDRYMYFTKKKMLFYCKYILLNMILICIEQDQLK